MSSEPIPDEDKFLALLNEVHRFPTAYDMRIICVSEAAPTLAARLVEATRLELVGEPTQRHSAGGKFVSVHLSVLAKEAPDVVTAYRALRGIEGVKTFF
jgi:putative lipoic acid-binding regulatory protein